jgi:hypothetical protein
MKFHDTVTLSRTHPSHNAGASVIGVPCMYYRNSRKEEVTLKSVEVIQMGGMYHFELQHWLNIFDNVQNEFSVPFYIHNFLSIFFCVSAISCCLVIIDIFLNCRYRRVKS